MRTCSVDNCKNKVKFTFPKCEKRKKAWLEIIRRPDFESTGKMGLCINHFKKTDLHDTNDSYGKCLEKIYLINMHDVKNFIIK